jgi:hypothetical protein
VDNLNHRETLKKCAFSHFRPVAAAEDREKLVDKSLEDMHRAGDEVAEPALN